MAYNRRKRKVKKNIPEAQAHISSSYNNTLVTITDVNGTSSFDVMDTIIDKTEAAIQMLNNFVYIGSTEPTSTPVIWFNTGTT